MALISYNQLKEVLTDFKTKIQAKFVEDIAYDVITNKLSKTKNGNTEVVVDHVVENWGDLEHTKYAKIKNIFDKNNIQDNKYFTVVTGGGGEIRDGSNCVVGFVSCSAGEEFTIIKGKTPGVKKIKYLNQFELLLKYILHNH